MLYRDYTYSGYETSYVHTNGNAMVLYTHRRATMMVDEEGWLYRVGNLDRELTNEARHAIREFMNDFDLGSYQMGLKVYINKIKYNIYTGEVA